MDMEFFDDIGRRFNDAADKLVAKSKDFVGLGNNSGISSSEMANLKAQKKNIEKKLTGYYCQLGKAYYENSGHKCENIYSELVAVIEAENKNLLKVVNAIDCANGIKTCKACHAKVSADSIFCNICGTRLVEEQPVNVQPAVDEQLPENNIVEENAVIEQKDVTSENNNADVNVDTSEEGINVENNVVTEEYPVTEENTESDVTVEEPEINTPQERICSNCGNKIREGAIFCTNCGTKYE